MFSTGDKKRTEPKHKGWEQSPCWEQVNETYRSILENPYQKEKPYPVG